MPLVRDLRYACRLLVKQPGFAIVAVLTLALGLGATTAIFTVVQSVLLRPLPFPDPDRLMQVEITGRKGVKFPLPDADFEVWRGHNDTADAVAVFTPEPVTVTGDGPPERVLGTAATDQFFKALGARAALGRVLQDGDDRPGAPRTAVISHAFWQRRFAGRPDIVGRAITLAAVPHTIVGVMPPTFDFPRHGVEVWRVLPMKPPKRRGPFYGTPLIRGRFFDERDVAGAPPVAIINETLARQYFPNADPIDRRIKVGGPERPNNQWMTIVGVVADVKYDGLATPTDPTFYEPFRQVPYDMQFVVLRTAAEPRSIAAAARGIVAGLDKDLPLADVKTMDELMAESVAPPRFRTTLVSLFAMIGLVLAAIGIYGVMAYAVTERTHELGVRLALGATSGDVLRLVFGEAIVLAAIGVALGIAGAMATTRLMRALLFGVEPTDALTFAALAAVLVATALLASYMPARRAMRVDPMVALRYE